MKTLTINDEEVDRLQKIAVEWGYPSWREFSRHVLNYISHENVVVRTDGRIEIPTIVKS